MTVQTQQPQLPTLDEWRSALMVMGDLDDGLEMLVRRLEHVSAPGGGYVPTIEDVGVLYVALESLEVDRANISWHAARIRAVLEKLPALRDERGKGREER